MISCLRSDIVHEWTLSPAPGGCDVAVRVTIPDEESARLDAMRAEVAASLARLVEVAQTACPRGRAGRRSRRSTGAATRITMMTPIRAPSTPPQSKMSSSPMPRPRVKMT